MKILELFAGSRSFSKVAEKLGHQVYTTDYESFDKIKSLGWKPKYSIKEGIEKLYPWIEQEIKNPSDILLKERREKASCCD